MEPIFAHIHTANARSLARRIIIHYAYDYAGPRCHGRRVVLWVRVYCERYHTPDKRATDNSARFGELSVLLRRAVTRSVRKGAAAQKATPYDSCVAAVWRIVGGFCNNCTGCRVVISRLHRVLFNTRIAFARARLKRQLVVARGIVKTRACTGVARERARNATVQNRDSETETFCRGEPDCLSRVYVISASRVYIWICVRERMLTNI